MTGPTLVVLLPFVVVAAGVEGDKLEVGPLSYREASTIQAEVQATPDLEESEARTLIYAARMIRRIGDVDVRGKVKGADLLEWPHACVEVLTDAVGAMLSEVTRFRGAHPIAGSGGVAHREGDGVES